MILNMFLFIINNGIYDIGKFQPPFYFSHHLLVLLPQKRQNVVQIVRRQTSGAFAYKNNCHDGDTEHINSFYPTYG